jgi:hypothetical protein
MLKSKFGRLLGVAVVYMSFVGVANASIQWVCYSVYQCKWVEVERGIQKVCGDWLVCETVNQP